MMERRMTAVRYFAYALEFFVLHILSQTPGLLPAIEGVRPVPLIAAAVAAALFESEVPSMAFGIAAGLLIDFGMGCVLGFHAVVLAALCFLISWLCRNLLRVNFLTCLVASLVVAAVLLSLQWVLFVFLAGQSGAGHIYVRYILPRAGYSALFCLLVYPIHRGLFSATA